MTKLRFGLALLLVGAAWASYQYYYADNLTTIDLTKWTQNGNLVASANGLTSANVWTGGSLVSTVAAPDGNDYDAQMTIHLQGDAGSPQFSLYARASPNTSAYYRLTSEGACYCFQKSVPGQGITTLLWLPWTIASDGAVWRILVQGNKITVWANSPYPTVINDSDVPTGQPGVAVWWATSATVSNVKFGPIDRVAPAPIPTGYLWPTVSPTWVDLNWLAQADDPNGVGMGGYAVYRDGVFLGNTPIPNWTDESVTSNTTVTYSVYVYDQHWNYSPPTSVTRFVYGLIPDQRRIGVRSTGSYWGGAGEQIDMNSGNLNFSIPLVKALGRGGWSVTFALSYNSQMWRNDPGTPGTTLLGQDIGEGLGWRIQAGSIRPVWFNMSVHHFVSLLSG